MSENTQVAQAQTFEEKMKSRIKDSIGDLITDEQIKLLIEKAMKETFFETTYKPNPNGYSNKIEVPPLLPAIVKELLAEQIRAGVDQYIKDHASEIVPVIEKLLRDGAGQLFVEALSSIFAPTLSNLQMNVNNLMQFNQNNHGRSY
jgi:hypothetical protein